MEGIECEICGRPLTRSYKIEVEGTVVEVCEKCLKYGKLIKTPGKVIKRKVKVKEKEIEGGFVLVENYGKVVKDAREKLGLDRKELGKKIGEKESVLKKVEEERIRPDDKLIRKLEKTLGVKLLKKAESKVTKVKSKEEKLTLGDVIVLRTK